MDKEISLPYWEELPDIELYMDQVVTLLQSYLKDFQLANNESFISKSMINNYVKAGLVSPPKKKKYTRTHIAYLIAVCILKQVYSMNEITQMIRIQMQSAQVDQAYDLFISELLSCYKDTKQNKKIDLDVQYQNEKTRTLLRRVLQSVMDKHFVQKELIQRQSSNE